MTKKNIQKSKIFLSSDRMVGEAINEVSDADDTELYFIAKKKIKIFTSAQQQQVCSLQLPEGCQTGAPNPHQFSAA